MMFTRSNRPRLALAGRPNPFGSVGAMLLSLLLLVGLLVAAPGRAAAAAAVRIMPIGDSITAGDDGDHTWRYRLAQHLTQAGTAFDFVGDHSAPNRGSYAVAGWDGDHQAVWGMPAWQQKDETRAAVERHNPDYVVLHLGTNDLAGGNPALTVIEDVTAIIAAARAAEPTVKFLLVQIVPRLETADTLTNDYNARLSALASTTSTEQSPVRVTDAHTGFSADDDLYDGTHPNRVGEYKIAAAVARGLWRSYQVGADYGAIPATTPGPDVPGGVSVAAEDGAATISWSAVRGATGYQVYARNLSESETAFKLVQFGVTGTSWRQTLLFNGQQLEYRVTALRWFDESPPSVSVRVVPTAPRPAAPQDVRTTSTGNTVTVRWAAVSAVDDYTVYARDVTAGGQLKMCSTG